MSADEQRPVGRPAGGGSARDRGRVAGIWGCVFTVMLLLSASMASVPGGADSTADVRRFYTAHIGVVVAAQVVGLLAAAAFFLFARSLGGRPAAGVGGDLGLRSTGVLVAAAAAVTAIPVLWLAAVAPDGSAGLLHGLAVASDLTDGVLFLAIAGFAAATAVASTTVWLRIVAAAVALASLARSVLLVLGSSRLELTAPVGFVLLVLLLSALSLFHRAPLRGATAPPR